MPFLWEIYSAPRLHITERIWLCAFGIIKEKEEQIQKLRGDVEELKKRIDELNIKKLPKRGQTESKGNIEK